MAVISFTRAPVGSDGAVEAAAGTPTLDPLIFAGAAVGATLGIRFQAPIPVGATITSVVLTGVVSDSSKNDAEGTWRGEDADDAAAFTTADGNVDGRTSTAATVAWTTNDLGSAGASFSTPNLAAIVQEIVDRPGWEHGNHVALFYRHNSGAEVLQFAMDANAVYAGPSIAITYSVDDYGVPDPIVEAAFGADLNGNYLDWVWTDLSDRLIPQTVTIKRGRADESTRAAAANVSVVLDNTDGALTPDHPVSLYYPHVDRGTPLRVRLDGYTTDTPYLSLNGDVANYASTPDAAGHDFTGDMAMWMDADLRGSSILIGKWEDTSDERSYYLYLSGTWRLAFAWSEDGTGAGIRFCYSSIPTLDPTVFGRSAYGVEVDADDGAGGFVVRFYTAPTAAGPWTQLGDDVTQDGATVPDASSITIYAGTAPLTIGVPVGAVPDGQVYSAGTRTGTSLTGGTIISNPDFGAQTVGATSFTDTAATPKTWTLQGAAEIMDTHPGSIRFFGQMDGISPTWPEGDNGEAEVEISASGMLRRLGQGNKALASTLYRGVMSQVRDPLDTTTPAGVVAYWPLEDDRGSPAGASPIPGVPPLSVGPNWEFGSDSSFAASKPLPSQRDLIYFATNVPDYLTTGPIGTRVDSFMYITAPSGGFYWAAINTTGTVLQWRISYSGSLLTVQGIRGDGVMVVNNTSGLSSVFFDTWSLWSFKVSDDGAGTVTYALTIVKIPDGFGSTYTATTSGVAGNVTAIHNWGTACPADGQSMGHLIVSTGKAVGWLAGYDTAWVGESAAHRFARLCDEEGITFRCIGDPTPRASFRGDTSLSQAMGPQLPQPLLDLFQECVEADFGMMGEERDRFGLIYRTGRSLLNQTPRLALDATTREEGGRVVSDVRNPLAPTKDDQRIRNDVTAKREGGSLFRVTTDPPPPPDDLYDEEVSLNVEADIHLVDIANWRLHLGTWPGMRYRNLTTDLSDSPHLVADWLDMNEGDRITVTGLPSSHPSTTVDVLVEGMDEAISPHSWVPLFNASPGGPWIVGEREGTGEFEARRDSTDTVLDDDMSTVDTAVLFMMPTTIEWTQEAGDYPLDIAIGGEQMTATAIIDHGAGLFEFEVVRSVNGVVKAHTAGDAITLWQPAYRGF